MQNFPDAGRRLWKKYLRAVRGKGPNPDNPFGLEDRHHSAQMAVAGSAKRGGRNGGKFVGRKVAPNRIEECERAVVHDEMLRKKVFRGSESFRKQTPEPPPTDLGSQAGKTRDVFPGMFVRGLADGRRDTQPVPHSGDLAKRDAGLGHAKGAGIHAEKNDALAPATVPPEIHRVRVPGVIERVVNVRHGQEKFQLAGGLAKVLCGGDELGGHGALVLASGNPAGRAKSKNEHRNWTAVSSLGRRGVAAESAVAFLAADT